MKPVSGMIYRGICNFCRNEDIDVTFLNYQAICKNCACQVLLPIIKTFAMSAKKMWVLHKYK